MTVLFLLVISGNSVLILVYCCLMRLICLVILSLMLVNDGTRRHGWITVFSSKDGHNLITNMKVQYHTGCCDHIPLTLDISTECIPELETVGDDNDNLRVNWNKMSAANLEEYTRNTDIHLNGIETPVDALCCKDIDCMNENHRIALDVYYRELVHAMTKAGQRRARRDKTFNSQSGWNEHVSGLHKVARNCFIIWRSNGKPRQGEEFESMRQTRLQFKYALRYVKQHENISCAKTRWRRNLL